LGPWAFREVFYSFSGPGGYLSPTTSKNGKFLSANLEINLFKDASLLVSLYASFLVLSDSIQSITSILLGLLQSLLLILGTQEIFPSSHRRHISLDLA
jgi:hypothetical protein